MVVLVLDHSWKPATQRGSLSCLGINIFLFESSKPRQYHDYRKSHRHILYFWYSFACWLISGPAGIWDCGRCEQQSAIEGGRKGVSCIKHQVGKRAQGVKNLLHSDGYRSKDRQDILTDASIPKGRGDRHHSRSAGHACGHVHTPGVVMQSARVHSCYSSKQVQKTT